MDEWSKSKTLKIITTDSPTHNDIIHNLVSLLLLRLASKILIISVLASWIVRSFSPLDRGFCKVFFFFGIGREKAGRQLPKGKF